MLTRLNILKLALVAGAPLLTWLLYLAAGEHLVRILGAHVAMDGQMTKHLAIRYIYKSLDLALFFIGTIDCIHIHRTYRPPALKRRSLDILTLFCISLLFAIYLGHIFNVSPLFREIRSEDSVLEYLTFFLLAFVALVFFRKSVLRGATFPGALCFVAGLSFLFVALEEVSWFQRILHLRTPDFLAGINVQGELNIHNSTNHLHPPIYALSFFFLGAVFGSLSHQGNNPLKLRLSKFMDIGATQTLTSNYQLYSRICYVMPLLFLISWSHAQELSEEIFAVMMASLALQSLTGAGSSSEQGAPHRS